MSEGVRQRKRGTRRERLLERGSETEGGRDTKRKVA